MRRSYLSAAVVTLGALIIMSSPALAQPRSCAAVAWVRLRCCRPMRASAASRRRFASSIEGTFLPNVDARKTLAAGRVPGLVDMTLDQLLGWSRAPLTTTTTTRGAGAAG